MHLACLEHTLGIQAVGSRLSLRIEWKQIEVIQCVMEASLVHHLLLHITVKTCLSEKSFFIAVKLLLCAKKLISLIKFDFNFCCSLIQNSCFFFFVFFSTGNPFICI